MFINLLQKWPMLNLHSQRKTEATTEQWRPIRRTDACRWIFADTTQDAVPWKSYRSKTITDTETLPNYNFFLSSKQALWSICCTYCPLCDCNHANPTLSEAEMNKAVVESSVEITSFLLSCIFHACVAACDSYVAIDFYFVFHPSLWMTRLTRFTQRMWPAVGYTMYSMMAKIQTLASKQQSTK